MIAVGGVSPAAVVSLRLAKVLLTASIQIILDDKKDESVASGAYNLVTEVCLANAISGSSSVLESTLRSMKLCNKKDINCLMRIPTSTNTQLDVLLAKYQKCLTNEIRADGLLEDATQLIQNVVGVVKMCTGLNLAEQMA